MGTYATHFPEAADAISAALTGSKHNIPALYLGTVTVQWHPRDYDQALTQLQQIAEQATQLRRQIVQYTTDGGATAPPAPPTRDEAHRDAPPSAASFTGGLFVDGFQPAAPVADDDVTGVAV